MFAIRTSNPEKPYLRSYSMKVNQKGRLESELNFSESPLLAKKFSELQKVRAEEIVKGIQAFRKAMGAEPMQIEVVALKEVITIKGKIGYVKSISVGMPDGSTLGNTKVEFTADRNEALVFTKQDAIDGVMRILQTFPNASRFVRAYI